MSDHSSAEALASFLNITGSDSATASQYLELTNWNLEEAVNLYMESGAASINLNGTASPMPSDLQLENNVRAPDPSKRQRLVGAELDFSPPRRSHNRYRDFAAETVAASIFASNSTDDTAAQHDQTSQEFNSLFKPPMQILFQGSYSEARQQAREDRKWLLVNIQDELVFASHMLNRDTWSDDVVQNVVASGFVFWQNFWATDSGKKFCALYQLERESLPIICIIDPRTGQLNMTWNGFIEPAELVERLSDFSCQRSLESPPSAVEIIDMESVDNVEETEDGQLAAAIAASLEPSTDACQSYEEEEMKDVKVIEILPPEPSDFAEDITRIQLRSPDGSRLIRRFYKSDPVSMLQTYVKENVRLLHNLKEVVTKFMKQIAEARDRPFELRTAYPPMPIVLDSSTFRDQNLNNSVLIIHWIQ